MRVSAKELGKWAAQRRAEAGLTQEQLAAALGVSQQTVARY
jgi:transcriptional regulator with XRE-family HTH domain